MHDSGSTEHEDPPARYAPTAPSAPWRRYRTRNPRALGLIALPARKRPRRPSWARTLTLTDPRGHFLLEVWRAEPMVGIRVCASLGALPVFQQFWAKFPRGAGPGVHPGPWEIIRTYALTMLTLNKGRYQAVATETKPREAEKVLLCAIAGAVPAEDYQQVEAFLTAPPEPIPANIPGAVYLRRRYPLYRPHPATAAV